MHIQENFIKENIDRLCLVSGNVPFLLERKVCVFGMLEAMLKVGVPFIFDYSMFWHKSYLVI